MCISTHSHKDRTIGLDFLKRKGIRTYTTKMTDSISRRDKQRRATYLIDNDTTFRIAEHEFQVYYAGPGHTADNIVIWFEKEKVLYGGCLVKSTDATDLGNIADANTKAWPETIKNIQSRYKNAVYVIPGHFSWSNKNSLEHTLRLLQRNEENIKKAVR